MNGSAMATAIVPARLESKRLPRKLLQTLPNGRTVLTATCDAARRAERIRRVVVATDSDEIAAVAEADGLDVIRTGQHDCGTSRVAEAARKLGLAGSDFVLNVQGDEPLLRPEALDRLIERAAQWGLEAATLACPLRSEEWADPNAVKVATTTRSSRRPGVPLAVWFWRMGRGRQQSLAVWKHVGVYLLTARLLDWFAAQEPAIMERRARLEQWRLLENGIPIGVVVVPWRTRAVDTEADLEAVRQELRAVAADNHGGDGAESKVRTAAVKGEEYGDANDVH